MLLLWRLLWIQHNRLNALILSIKEKLSSSLIERRQIEWNWRIEGGYSYFMFDIFKRLSIWIPEKEGLNIGLSSQSIKLKLLVTDLSYNLLAFGNPGGRAKRYLFYNKVVASSHLRITILLAGIFGNNEWTKNKKRRKVKRQSDWLTDQLLQSLADQHPSLAFRKEKPIHRSNYLQQLLPII